MNAFHQQRSSDIAEKPKAGNRSKRLNEIIASAIAILSLLTVSTDAQGQAVSLGAAENFTIVSSQGVTNSGLTVITGNVALSPLTTITGFSFSTPPGGGVITGSVHYADALAGQAQANALTAFNTLAGLAYIPANNKTGLDLGGMTLAPGVYHFDTSVGLTGNLTLATGADPNAVFVFQIGSTLTAAVGSSITVTGAGAGSDPNVFWQVGSSATLNTGSLFNGNILALASVSLGMGSTLTDGRAIALNGAVTLLANDLSAPPLPPSAPGRFWNGSANNLWSSTNWSSTVAGADQIVLGSGPDVVFSVNGPPPTPQNQNTILDSDTTISSLTVNDPAAVTIGGSNTLTISATGLTTGININSGAGLTTISSNLVLGDLSQIITVNNAAGMLVSGVIGGINGLTKSGTGALTLTGIETYTGVTVVTGGTLQLGNGITPGTSIASSSSVFVTNTTARNSVLAINLNSGETFGNNVTDNGLVTAIASGTNTISGIISGSGSLSQEGSGVTVLTGANTFTGLTTVDQGTLAVNGAIAGNALVNGGTLRGFGRIGGNVVNRALVVPGDTVTPGTLTIGGNYTQTAQGTLGIRLASTSNFDRLMVGGGANLNGTLTVGYLNGFTAKLGDEFKIIETQTGVSGQFSQFLDAHANPNPLLTLKVVYQPDNVLLRFDQGSFTTLLREADPSELAGPCIRNELAVAHALDKLAAAKPSDPLILELDRLSSVHDVAAALNVISPEDFAAIFNAGIAISNVQVGNIERRMEEARMGSTGFSDSGLVLTDSRGTQNYDNSGKNVISPDGKVTSGKEMHAPITEDTKRWGFFAAGVGEFTDVENTCSSRGSEFTTGGVTLGADYRVSDHFILGATMGYANTTSDLNAAGRLNIDSGKASLYATVYDGGFYVNGIVGGGMSSYSTRRGTFGGIARGDTDGRDINALIGTGYDFHIGAFTVGPVASLQYTEVQIDGFTEKGSLAPLHFNSQSQDSFTSNLGAKAAYALKLGHIIVTPEIRAQWQHEYLDDRAGIGASFGGGNSFTVYGPRIGRDSLILDVGASVQLTSNIAVFAFYTGDLGRENYTSHSINGGVRIDF